MENIVLLDVPTDQNILAELGRIALKHGQLEHMLKMLLVMFTGVTVKEAVDATKYEGSKSLRDRIRKLAKSKLGEGKALVQLQALLERCARASEKRNNLVHSLWAYDLDGEHMIQGSDHAWKACPSTNDLKMLASEIDVLIRELIFARLEGFLFDAMNK